MNYGQAVKFIESRQRYGVNLGLSRINKLLSLFGDPQNKFKNIHIAGTNGKGSVAAMLSAVLSAAGYRTGLYTSPHLISYTERIRINEKDISEKEFSSAVSIVKSAFEKNMKAIGDLTTFEVLTAAAFAAFEKARVEIAVVEVGMGGRLDATNVLRPLVSVITNVDIDHAEVLGKTIGQIAAEKAGIIKTGVPVVTAAKGEALNVISAKCRNVGTTLVGVRRKPKIKPPLIGEHQSINLGVVLNVLGVLRRNGVDVGRERIEQSLKRTRWPGRFQIVSRKPLVILDGAHNPTGAKALKEAISEVDLQGPTTLILGILENKDFRSIVRTLAPAAQRIIVTRSSHPGAAKEDRLAEECRKYNREVMKTASVKGALDLAKKYGKRGSIVVTGSLSTVADAMKYLIY